ncbi:MAG: hypothetical protein U0670_17620 [Anaerolineae bacterium]
MVLIGGVLLALIAVLPVFAFTTSFTGNILSGAQYDLYTVDLIAGEQVTASLTCEEVAPGNRPLDPVLSAYFPGSDPSSTANADFYNDDNYSEVHCNSFYSSRLSFSAPVTGTYTFRADGFGSATGPYTLRISTTNGSPLALDGRINPEPAAPVVVYCEGTGVHLFSPIGTDLGSVEAGGSLSVAGVHVGPMADGRMQLTAPMADKTYMLIWTGCTRGTSYAYTVEGAATTLFSTYSY